MQFPLQTIEQLQPIIQGFRKRAGLTQAAMAEKLGITQQSYAQIESNLRATSVERLYTILRMLHVELNFSSSDATPDFPTWIKNGNIERFTTLNATETSDVQQKAPRTPQRPANTGQIKKGQEKKLASSSSISPVAVKQPDKTKW